MSDDSKNSDVPKFDEMPAETLSQLAQVANQLSQHALAEANVTKLMMRHLLQVLFHSGMVSQPDLEKLFRAAHRQLSESAKEKGGENKFFIEYMFKQLAQTAKEHDVDLPEAPIR